MGPNEGRPASWIGGQPNNSQHPLPGQSLVTAQAPVPRSSSARQPPLRIPTASTLPSSASGLTGRPEHSSNFHSPCTPMAQAPLAGFAGPLFHFRIKDAPGSSTQGPSTRRGNSSPARIPGLRGLKEKHRADSLPERTWSPGRTAEFKYGGGGRS